MYMYMYISKTRERVPAQDLVAFIFSNKTWKNAIFSTSREPPRYNTTHNDAEQVSHISGEAEYIHIGAPRRVEACQVVPWHVRDWGDEKYEVEVLLYLFYFKELKVTLAAIHFRVTS